MLHNKPKISAKYKISIYLVHESAGLGRQGWACLSMWGQLAVSQSRIASAGITGMTWLCFTGVISSSRLALACSLANDTGAGTKYKRAKCFSGLSMQHIYQHFIGQSKSHGQPQNQGTQKYSPLLRKTAMSCVQKAWAKVGKIGPRNNLPPDTSK